MSNPIRLELSSLPTRHPLVGRVLPRTYSEGGTVIVSHIDPEARSTIAVAEGGHALGHGDTLLAREKYAEAGRILEQGTARTSKDSALCSLTRNSG